MERLSIDIRVDRNGLYAEFLQARITLTAISPVGD
jgi:hypothetical protein